MKEINIEECKNCAYCREVRANGGWRFLGCFHTPLKGMILCEVKVCPKQIRKEYYGNI